MVAGSSLRSIDGSGGKLAFRGSAIEDLPREASFEEEPSLLWHGKRPTREELEASGESMAAERMESEGLDETTARGRPPGIDRRGRRRWVAISHRRFEGPT